MSRQPNHSKYRPCIMSESFFLPTNPPDALIESLGDFRLVVGILELRSLRGTVQSSKCGIYVR